MKGFIKDICKGLSPCVVEILAYVAIYYCLVHTTDIGSRPEAGMALPGVCICIVIANIILNIKTEVLIEYLGKWIMVSFVFMFILTGAVLYGCVPDASMRLIFVVSSTMALPIVGYSKMFGHFFEEQQDDYKEPGHYNFLGINMEELKDEKKESQK